MRKIVISAVRSNLDRFLQIDKGRYFYLAPGLCHADIEEFLEEKGHKRADINEGLGSLDFKKEYVDFIGRLNRDHDSLYWWATTVSYKGMFITDLCKDIFNYYCIMALIKKNENNYIIINKNFILNSYIKKYCGENGIECMFLDKQKAENNIARFRRYCMSNAYFLWDGWMRKTTASVLLSKGIKEKIKQKGPYYIIRSWIDKRCFSGGGAYNDSYFGRLPEYLQKKGIDFFILAGVLTDYRRLIRSIKDTKGILIIPQEYFAGYLDYIKVIVLNFIHRPKLKGRTLFCGLDVADFLADSLSKDYEYNEVNKNLIYYFYIRGLLKKINVNIFLFPFENQAWERMSIIAIRKCAPLTKLIGYAHSFFRPYLLGYLFSNEEKDIVPLPDKIVTVGREFRLALENYGNYGSRAELSEGCALRYERTLKKGRIPLKKDGKILAVLSMHMGYSVKLFRFLHNALAGNNKYRIILRSHPFLPVETIMKLYNLKLGDNFQISKRITFEEELRDISLLVYSDTTASMEALSCGVPVVHIDLKEPMSLDPLLGLNSLKWTVSDKDGLCKAIDHVRAMDDKEYTEKYTNAVIYLSRCFYPVEEKYLREFIT